MKKRFVLLFIFLVSTSVFSQKTEKRHIINNINKYYISFVKKDTSIASAVTHPKVKLIELKDNYISNSYYGWESLKISILNENDKRWRKVINKIKVKIDTNTANVWVKYHEKLFSKNKFKKTENFFMRKENNEWRIILISYFIL